LSENPVIFVHQSSWQQKMLLRYGNYITLLDCTYRTNIYDLPLLVLSVPTNAGYVAVASALLCEETKDAITFVLQTLSAWNPDWKPKLAISDFCEAQLAAFESVFPGTCI
jgi:MULE transposase domain